MDTEQQHCRNQAWQRFPQRSALNPGRLSFTINFWFRQQIFPTVVGTDHGFEPLLQSCVIENITHIGRRACCILDAPTLPGKQTRCRCLDIYVPATTKKSLSLGQRHGTRFQTKEWHHAIQKTASRIGATLSIIQYIESVSRNDAMLFTRLNETISIVIDRRVREALDNRNDNVTGGNDRINHDAVIPSVTQPMRSRNAARHTWQFSSAKTFESRIQHITDKRHNERPFPIGHLRTRRIWGGNDAERSAPFQPPHHDRKASKATKSHYMSTEGNTRQAVFTDFSSDNPVSMGWLPSG